MTLFCSSRDDLSLDLLGFPLIQRVLPDKKWPDLQLLKDQISIDSLAEIIEDQVEDVFLFTFFHHCCILHPVHLCVSLFEPSLQHFLIKFR